MTIFYIYTVIKLIMHHLSIIIQISNISTIITAIPFYLLLNFFLNIFLNPNFSSDKKLHPPNQNSPNCTEHCIKYALARASASSTFIPMPLQSSRPAAFPHRHGMTVACEHPGKSCAEIKKEAAAQR